jgi:hypothetical protein
MAWVRLAPYLIAHCRRITRLRVAASSANVMREPYSTKAGSWVRQSGSIEVAFFTCLVGPATSVTVRLTERGLSSGGPRSVRAGRLGAVYERLLNHRESRWWYSVPLAALTW